MVKRFAVQNLDHIYAIVHLHIVVRYLQRLECKSHISMLHVAWVTTAVYILLLKHKKRSKSSRTAPLMAKNHNWLEIWPSSPSGSSTCAPLDKYQSCYDHFHLFFSFAGCLLQQKQQSFSLNLIFGKTMAELVGLRAMCHAYVICVTIQVLPLEYCPSRHYSRSHGL